MSSRASDRRFNSRSSGCRRSRWNTQGHGNPSKAFQAGTGLPGNGWYYWHYRADNGEWQRIDALRSEYRRKVERVNLTLVQDAKPDTA